MTRKKKNIASQRDAARPEGFAGWLQSFEGNEGVPSLMQQLSSKGVDVERVKTVLYAAPFFGGIKSRDGLSKLEKDLAAVQRYLDGADKLLRPFPFPPPQHAWVLGMLGCVRTQVSDHRHLLAEWRSAFTTIQLTDLIIAIIAQDLGRAGSRKVNEELATLLTAAAVPGGTRDEVANGWAWDAATWDKRRDRLKAKPLAALGPFRHLFENVNIEKLSKKYPALFIRESSKGKHEHKTIGQKIAASTDLPTAFESPAAEEAFWKAFREGFSKPPVGTKNCRNKCENLTPAHCRTKSRMAGRTGGQLPYRSTYRLTFDCISLK